MSEYHKKIEKLLQKWHEGELNEEEAKMLNLWLESLHFDEVPMLSGDEFADEKFFQNKYRDILQRAASRKPARIISFRSKAVAAAVILIFAAFWYQYVLNKADHTPEVAQNKIEHVEDIVPGQEGAILSLSNGSQILLDSASQGPIAHEGNTVIDNNDGMLSYRTSKKTEDEILTNTLSIPGGREYRLQLPDGSVVWINSMSTITFPTRFTDKERRVSLQGEAYFEVAKSSRKDGSRIPFIIDVQSDSGKKNEVSMEVLGTSFNLNAYPNEKDIRTTLLEGSVRVHAAGKTQMLTPSRQAIISADGVTSITSDVNIDQVIAWRNGMFYFDHTDLATILRQFSRWYGIEIIAVNSNATRTFTGKINRNMKLVDVLKIMDLSNIRYTIEDGKMIIDGIASNK